MQKTADHATRLSMKLFAVLSLLLFGGVCFSQTRDTNYIDEYKGQLTCRIFLSQKYTIFGLKGSTGYREIQYRPNTNLAFGAGATYRALSLNLSYGFQFINPDKEKGKTKYLDLQTHIYGQKWRYDLFAQFYKGYYMFPRGFAASSITEYYKRADLKVTELGASAFYIYNNKRYSYRAALQQSEWQKKSAGSLLLGGGITMGNVHGDSSFVPTILAPNYQQRDIKELRYFEIGPGIGYAYTLVWRQNWFMMASASLSLDFGFLKEFTDISHNSTLVLSPNFLFRFVLGYNGGNWNANFSWVSNRTALTGQYPKGGYNVNTGNYRFTVARRFSPTGKVRKFFDKVDRTLDKYNAN